MLHLPERIADRVGSNVWNEIKIGYSGARLFRSEEKHRCYLKYMPADAKKSLRHETEVMAWLEARLPVPRVIEFVIDEFGEYLLMSEVPGKSFAEHFAEEPGWLAEKYAEALLRIHDLPVLDCPFDESNQVKVRRALNYCDEGLVKPEYFREDRQGLGVEGLKRLLTESASFQEDFVFTHGDYCFPNVILYGDRLSGFVDWSAAGLADRYQDLSIGVRSLRYNLQKLKRLSDDAIASAVEVFMKAYGITKVDMDKIEYYQLLDDFFR